MKARHLFLITLIVNTIINSVAVIGVIYNIIKKINVWGNLVAIAVAWLGMGLGTLFIYMKDLRGVADDLFWGNMIVAGTTTVINVLNMLVYLRFIFALTVAFNLMYSMSGVIAFGSLYQRMVFESKFSHQFINL